MIKLASLLLFLSLIAAAQTTQGLISGRLLNSRTGKPIAAATVTYASAATDETGSYKSDPAGYYYLPLLSPGFYSVQVAAENYQSQEIQELELRVAARIELDFHLRPLNDIWESGQYNSVFLPGSHTIVTFYGPDVDPSRSSTFEAQRGRRGALESTISQVIDPAQIRELPLAGRDVYTMLATMPGVTSDTTTTRGLGLSVNGQRPSSSNFLLDGVENNNYLVTGPLNPVAPEAMQEYRVSTNNFSAEYGRTSGFVANAVTRAGTSRFHGVGYLYFKNDALNANGFQENLMGIPRTPDKENQTGYQVGGPVPIFKQKLFFSSAFDHLRSRSRRDPTSYLFPTTDFLPGFTTPTSDARKLLTQYPAPVVVKPGFLNGTLTLSQPVSVDRSIALERLDYATPSGADHIMGRLSIARVGRPDFIWSPYKDFISGLNQNTTGVALSWTRAIRPGLTNEAKLGFNDDDLHWDRAHPEIPTLASSDGTTLPGSSAFYAYKNHSRTWEILDNVVRTQGPHVVTLGAGMLFRSLDGFLTAGRDGEYLFNGIFAFASDQPTQLIVAVARNSLPATVLPQYDRAYSYRQYFLFGQDSFKVTSRFNVNYGLRYEQFGAPKNVGSVKDDLVQFGSGSNVLERLTSSRLIVPPAGDEQLYKADNHDFAVRAGFSYDLLGNARTVLRGAYGIFYDRPFDNLWQNIRNNNFVLPLFSLRATRTDYLQPIASVLPSFSGQTGNPNFPSLTMSQQDLRNSYAQSYFLGIQEQVTENIVLEVNGQGALGRRLITTDIVNRQFTTLDTGRPNPFLPDISYRAGQGLSNYNALTATARYRTSRAQFQAAYTWSHSIDNQSEPLAGDFFDLSFTRITSGGPGTQRSAFSRQFDSRADRGNSDFDQRHNLVIFSIWDLPAPAGNPLLNQLFRDWRFSQLAAFRSGFPYTVRVISTAGFGLGQIVNDRANLIDPRNAVLANPTPVPGGKLLLNASAFGEPDISTLGNLGRNALHGPGLYNIDLSLARSFAVRRLGEAGRFQVRADAFNVLNHANLNNPDPLLTSSTFGVARYGRQGQASGFPAVTPFNETARQIQLVLRLEF